MTNPDNITKLLIIRLGAMGDLLHVAPSLRVLKEAHPDIEIHLLTSPGYKALVEQFSEVNRVWTFEKGSHWIETGKRLCQLSQELKSMGINGVISLQPNLRSWLLTRLVLEGQSSFKKRHACYRKEKLNTSPKAERNLQRRHAVTDFYQPFRHLFQLPSYDKTRLIPQLPLSNALSKQTPPSQLQIAIIPGVGNKRANRAWPLQHYITLMKALSNAYAPSFQVVLIGGPDEKPLTHELEHSLIQEIPRFSSDCSIDNTCGQLDLLETAHRLSQCQLVIGGDTGPLHLASATGAPIVAIYGPTSAKRTGPLGKQPVTTITPPDNLDFWPCETPTCTQHSMDAYACIRPITPEKVLEACLKHLPVI